MGNTTKREADTEAEIRDDSGRTGDAETNRQICIADVIDSFKTPKARDFIRVKYSPYDIEACLKYWIQIGKQFDKRFSATTKNMAVYMNLIKYVHGDESGTLDLEKSLGFMGNTGSGKTIAMKIARRYMKIDDVFFIRNNKKIPFTFNIVSAWQIVREFSNRGYDGIEWMKHEPVFCIDDLGAENQTVNWYGSKVDVIEYLLEERYAQKNITHFTTNLAMEKLAEIYGTRVRSRLIGDTNIISFVDEDWRVKGAKTN